MDRREEKKREEGKIRRGERGETKRKRETGEGDEKRQKKAKIKGWK